MRGNNFAAIHARKTHCPRGHEYTPENTRISKRNERTCRACMRAHAMAYYRAHRGVKKADRS